MTVDPHACLMRIRAAQRDVAAAIASDATVRADLLERAADELCEAIGAMDGWLSRGGFLPEAWQR